MENNEEQLDEGRVYYRRAIRSSNADNDLNKEFGIKPDNRYKFEESLYKVFNNVKVNMGRSIFGDTVYNFRLNLGKNSAWLQVPRADIVNNAKAGDILGHHLESDIRLISKGERPHYWKGSVDALKKIYAKANGGKMITEDVIEEAEIIGKIDPRIATRIENETGYKVSLIRDNKGIEVYLKSDYCPRGQRYDITWFQRTGNVLKDRYIRDKTIDTEKIKEVCTKEFGTLKENYFPY